MMIARGVLSLMAAWVLLLAGGADAFSATSMARRGALATRMAMSTITTRSFDESTYHILLTKARECAFSEDASSSAAKDAQQFLLQILELESGCASGTVSDPQVCDTNVVELAEIVAQLRLKVQEQQARNVLFRDVSLGAGAWVLAVFLYLSEYHWSTSGSVPFTMQEWIWAAKGGYLDTMLAHFIRNGGL